MTGARSSENRLNSGGLFACPFYKFNPIEHDECKRYKFKQIPHLKQHIERRHSLSRHSCTICWVEFKDEQSKTNHLRNDKCEPKPQPEKLSAAEVEIMKRSARRGKMKQGANSRDHWLVVWNQLFRGFPAPSPYVHSNQFEEIKDRIWPGIAEAIDAGRASLMQKDKGQIDLPSFFRSTMDSAYSTFLQSLPISRHTPPSTAQENLDGDTGAAITSTPFPSSGDDQAVSSIGLGVDLYDNTIFDTEEYEVPFGFDD